MAICFCHLEVPPEPSAATVHPQPDDKQGLMVLISNQDNLLESYKQQQNKLM